MEQKNRKRVSEELKKLVIARLETLPANVSISVGSEGSFSKKDLIEQIANGTELGDKMVEVELEYLRRLKEGIFYASSSSNH